MKAVSILLCLALAQCISGSIFKRHPQVENLLVQPFDYISQYQQPSYQPLQQTYEEFIQSQKQRRARESDSSSHESTQESREKVIKDNQRYTQQPHHHHQHGKVPSFSPDKMITENDVHTTQGDRATLQELQVAFGIRPQDTDNQDAENSIFADAQQAMNHPSKEDKIKFHEAFEAADQKDDEEKYINATQLIKKHGYPVEEHTVQTDDGYILTVFHIPSKKQIRDVQQKVVFLMHGVLGSADDWLLMGPEKSLAYLLSDAGYDVWLGNARGNIYCRKHVTKFAELDDFWQFSNDEVALHDLPAMIDYVLETTHQKKLYYVGHSLGTTVFFALMAHKPEYNDKIIKMHALSPMVYMTHTRSPLIRMIAPQSGFQDRVQYLIGNGAFEPNKQLIHTFGGHMCHNEIGCRKVCSNVKIVMSGINIENVDPELMPVVISHLPAGASTKMIRHYGQGVSTEDFRQYSYGAVTNLQVYGDPLPPQYSMDKVSTPVAMYYSEEDWLSHPKDVAKLKDELPNVTDMFKVPDEHFSHMDFQFSKKAPELIYKRLIDSMTITPK